MSKTLASAVGGEETTAADWAHLAHDGEILIDGKGIREFSKSALRNAIGMVTQESFLFNGSIRDNLRLGKPGASDAELWDVLAAANATAFVQRLPETLDTVVGERGVKLSVGEKQRVSIARALLKDPPILILDEATSALDAATEARVGAALKRLMGRHGTREDEIDLMLHGQLFVDLLQIVRHAIRASVESYPYPTSPSLCARWTASVRLRTSSLRYTALVCSLTVWRER